MELICHANRRTSADLTERRRHSSSDAGQSDTHMVHAVGELFREGIGKSSFHWGKTKIQRNLFPYPKGNIFSNINYQELNSITLFFINTDIHRAKITFGDVFYGQKLHNSRFNEIMFY